MRTQTTELTENHPETAADRLRQAREAKGYSRAELSRHTGIPAKSVEKFEFGTQEPSLSRVQTLADALDVTVQWIMGDDDDMPETDAPQSSSRPTSPKSQVVEVDLGEAPIDQLKAQLEQLDDLRKDEFAGSQRGALVMIERIGSELRGLEPNELIDLAELRGLHSGECPSARSILDIFAEDPDEAQNFCGKVEERIIDTAVLGVDLYAVGWDALERLAASLADKDDSLEAPGWFGGWRDYETCVPLIRPALRRMAITGAGIDFGDRERFPRKR